MVQKFGRISLSVLVVLQAVQPAFARGWMTSAEPCGCAVEVVSSDDCNSCEPMESESATEQLSTEQTEPCNACGAVTETSAMETSSCGCESDAISSDTTSHEMPESAEPQAAETNKPQTFAPTVEDEPAYPSPAAETPKPTLENSATKVAPAPINVPSSTPTAMPAQEVFPGPAQAETAPATQPSPTNTEGLFDEPAAVAEPTDVEASPTAPEPAPASSETTPATEELFVEPSQPATDSSEEPATESTPATSTEESATETPVIDESTPEEDPLDELFGPATPSTKPESEPQSPPETQPEPQTQPETQPESDNKSEKKDGEFEDPFDPFGQLEQPRELQVAGGLASREFRRWSNRDDNFQCEARLVRLTTEEVFLSQPSGESVAMAFSQLSDADLHFVREQVRAQRTVLARAAGAPQLASRDSR